MMKNGKKMNVSRNAEGEFRPTSSPSGSLKPSCAYSCKGISMLNCVIVMNEKRFLVSRLSQIHRF